MYNNEIGNKLTTIDMAGDSLEMSTEALEMYHEATEMYHEGVEMSAEALEMYHEGVEMSTEAIDASDEIEDALDLSSEEKAAFDALGDCLEESMFEMEADLNPAAADAPVEGASANVCRSSQTPQNYCVFSGASRR